MTLGGHAPFYMPKAIIDYHDSNQSIPSEIEMTNWQWTLQHQCKYIRLCLLRILRTTEETLDIMWSVCDGNEPSRNEHGYMQVIEMNLLGMSMINPVYIISKTKIMYSIRKAVELDLAIQV